MRRCLTLIIPFVLLLPAPGQAAPFTPELEAAYQAALVDWGVPAPPLCTSVTGRIAPAAELAPYRGYATMPTEPMPCEIAIADNVRICEARGIMRHEVGHTLAYGHNRDPASIMYAAPPGLDGIEIGGGAIEWWCLAEIWSWREAGIRKQIARCRRVPRAHHRRRECWDYPRTWRRDLERERRMDPEPTIP